ncbi:hypothetical protein X778_13220 [Pseudomonas aeruginosa VRFPA07]|nr:hypothetical protein X778_13220 [Pseudomonas aeruginosa VRFPA07]
MAIWMAMSAAAALEVAGRLGTRGIGIKLEGTAGSCACWRRIHLCTRLALRPWLKATPATEAPGWVHSSTIWALKDLG